MTDFTPARFLPIPDLTRRTLLLGGGSAALAAALAGCSNNNNSTTGPSSGGGAPAGKNKLGLQLPDGAAPAEDQFYVQPFDSTGASYKSLDFYETVYSRAPLADEFGIPLVRLDNEYKIVPGAAKTWEQSADKLSWTFHLIPGITWSDGKELTAADFVETMRYSADPKHAWDFTWYWSGVIKNYAEAVEGKVTTDQVGVKQGADKYTVVIETAGPIGFLPYACLYTQPMSAAALSKYGSGSYNINPDTCVSCGPYILKTFDPTAHVVLGPNTKYSGPYVPPLTTLIGKIYAGGSMLTRFQTGEVDTFNPGPVDLQIAAKTPQVKDLHLYKNPQDFEIWYAFFDCSKPPFDNVKVRQAFAHSVDRDQIVPNILGSLGVPAYGYLMPGYPFAVTDPLKPLTNFDATKAKSLLADAGYPDGHGFPEITFNWYANAASKTDTIVQALAQGWNTTLGINIKLQELDKTTFYARMNDKPTKLTLGFVSYGMDYFDASNMLAVYKSGGRHNWDDKDYDKLLAQGAAESDPAKRQDIYTQAQTLLTGQAPGVFVFHLLYGQYFWPYIQGKALDKNSAGYDGVQWPREYEMSDALDSMYVASTVKGSKRQDESALL